MKQKVAGSRLKFFAWLAFVGYTIWWFYINVVERDPEHDSWHNKNFTNTYGVMALLGGLVGIFASRKWGGRKSLIGRALLFFGVGLLLQEFGQITYSYYYYVLHVDAPYPSIADIGYFGSVLVYIYAAWQLAKAAGIRFSLKDRRKKVIAVGLPLILLAASYLYFLKDYVFDFSSTKATLTVVLDFGYPLGQTIYLALALATYLLAKNILGGVMRSKILLVLFALLAQYVADFSFLNANKHGTFFAAGANDFMYLIAYFVMTLALIGFLVDFNKLGSADKDDTKETA